MIWILLACVENKVASAEENTEYHLLFTGQAPYQDLDNPGVWETDLDLEETWRLSLYGNQGAFGAQRLGEDTLLARLTQPPDPNLAVELVNREGNPLWTYDNSIGGALVFPHGVRESPWGQYLLADVFTSRILAVNPEKGVDWQIYTTDLRAAPSGFNLGMVDGTPMLVMTLLAESLTSSDVPDQVRGYWLKEDGVELAWSWPPEEKGLGEWYHGAHFQLDGSLLVSAAASGQIIELDPATGTEIHRIPEEPMLAFPRDAVLLPDGDMIVVDAVELLRVHDPFGAFEVTHAVSSKLAYSVDLINCSEDTCF